MTTHFHWHFITLKQDLQPLSQKFATAIAFLVNFVLEIVSLWNCDVIFLIDNFQLGPYMKHEISI